MDEATKQALAERDDWKARAEKWERRYNRVRQGQAKLHRRLDRIRAEANNSADMAATCNSVGIATSALDRIVLIIDGADDGEDEEQGA